jgi:hypothetical protein
MPKPRIRLRTLMIAVAVVGLLIGGGLEIERQRRRRHFRELADSCAKEASSLRSWAAELERRANDDPDSVDTKPTGAYRYWAAQSDAVADWMNAAASQAWPPPIGTYPPEPE